MVALGETSRNHQSHQHLYTMGTFNIHCKCHGNLSRSSQDISLKTAKCQAHGGPVLLLIHVAVVEIFQSDQPADRRWRPESHAVSVAKKENIELYLVVTGVTKEDVLGDRGRWWWGGRSFPDGNRRLDTDSGTGRATGQTAWLALRCWKIMDGDFFLLWVKNSSLKCEKKNQQEEKEDRERQR